MFAPARFPALALPEDVGGMLLDDGGVEVACTPLHAVASVARHDVVGAPPRELCVFGVVDAVKCSVVPPSRNLNLPAFRCRSGGLRSAGDKITATRRGLSRLAATRRRSSTRPIAGDTRTV